MYLSSIPPPTPLATTERMSEIGVAEAAFSSFQAVVAFSLCSSGTPKSTVVSVTVPALFELSSTNPPVESARRASHSKRALTPLKQKSVSAYTQFISARCPSSLL